MGVGARLTFCEPRRWASSRRSVPHTSPTHGAQRIPKPGDRALQMRARTRSHGGGGLLVLVACAALLCGCAPRPCVAEVPWPQECVALHNSTHMPPGSGLPDPKP